METEIIQNLVKSRQNEFLKCRRVNHMGQRLYVYDDPFRIYSGLTGALGKSMFKSEGKHLNTWRERMIDAKGVRFTDAYINTTADFGTLLHEALVVIQQKGEIDFDKEREIATALFKQQMFNKNIHYDIVEKVLPFMVEDYTLHLASLFQFIHERVTEIYAIEVPCIWDNVQISTPIDLYCMCRQTPKGDPVPTIINVKTSDSITDHHIKQLSCELEAWNQTYSDLNFVEYAAILRTKTYTGDIPTYQYKYIKAEEASHIAKRIERKLLLCKDDPEATYICNTDQNILTGKIKLGETPIKKLVTLEELLM